MKLKPALARLLMLTMLLTSLPPTPAHTASMQDEEEITDDEPGEDLRFRLSEGTEQVERPTPNPGAPATLLSETETANLLARLPALEPDAGDAQDFKLRERSLPPPRAGETIRAAFAPPATDAPPAPVRTTASLEVTRFAPEGEVELAPALSVTFSQPMVAVASQGEAVANVPVILQPQTKGSWRWLGTQTLVFQPETEGGRLPSATNYTVSIPAGTKSALGNALVATKIFNFATPPPTLKLSHPSGETQPRDALIYLEFDQRVDAARVLERIKLQPAGGNTRLRLATPKEIAADRSISELVKQAQAGRWLAVRAEGSNGTTRDALASDANIKVVIPPGTPSAEGPRATVKEQGFAFKTYGQLRVTETQCGYDKRCSPFDSFTIHFSNQLDEKTFQPSQVKLTPDIPGAVITASYNSITIEGVKRGRTNYTVALDRAIKDTFGQTLAGDNKIVFKVTTAVPRLFTLGEGFIVLDPAGRRAFTVYSVNYRRLKVSLYRVAPDDWQQFRRYQAERYQGKKPVSPPGKLVSEKVFDVRANPDELTETALDLSPALTNGFGQVFVKVEALEDAQAQNQPVNVYAYRQNKAESWVQSTEIGLDAFADAEQLVVWANSLRDGRPLAGVNVTVTPDNLAGQSDAAGLTRLSFKQRANDRKYELPLIVARRGQDVALLPQDYDDYYAGTENRSSWRTYNLTETLSWYVFDDRKLYRPGEEVNVKGWLRKINLTANGDTELFAAAGETANYVLKDSQSNEIAKGSAKLNALAGFDLKLQLPATMNLGNARLEFELEKHGGEHTHFFQVQEFRRPEFEITARASEAPHFVGTFATATMTAAYFAGGGLAETEVNWNVSSMPTNYTPPNRDDYTFGKFIPWWRDDDDDDEDGDSSDKTFEGRTDAAGKHTLRIDFDGVTPPRPSLVTAEARVQDVNRQGLAAQTTLLVHPSEVYVGLKSARTFVQQGEAFDVAAIATDLDGKAMPGRDIRLRLVRLDDVREDGEWVRQERDAQEQVIQSGADAVRVRFQTKEGGAYRLTAQVRDERERLNESELSLWVAGGKLPPQREVEQEEVELIPDRKSYAAGDVAEILVQSPFAPAEGVMTLRRSGLLRTERFEMSSNSHTLRVPLEEAMTPNVHVQVDLVGAAVRVDDEGNAQANLLKRPAFASGEINLEIPPAARRLNVTATPRDAVLEPGAETVVDVEVKDAQGRGAQGTDTAVVVVDESVLALTDYKLAHPLSVFYPAREAGVNDYHLREKVMLADPEDAEFLAEDGAGGGSLGRLATTTETVPVSASIEAMKVRELPHRARPNSFKLGGADNSDDAIQLRQNFNALAVFAASLPTDANGRAEVKVKLPDNLTRYRVVAVSVAGGKHFGAGESAITARQPLMVRPSPPRFLNFGDQAEFSVVVQNQTDAALSVNVAVRATNADLTAGAGRRVS
ncbi:MAG: alpha-2-macroglobulin family protein, partial [Pyrinomonadaceae bacterium]